MALFRHLRPFVRATFEWLARVLWKVVDVLIIDGHPQRERLPGGARRGLPALSDRPATSGTTRLMFLLCARRAARLRRGNHRDGPPLHRAPADAGGLRPGRRRGAPAPVSAVARGKRPRSSPSSSPSPISSVSLPLWTPFRRRADGVPVPRAGRLDAVARRDLFARRRRLLALAGTPDDAPDAGGCSSRAGRTSMKEFMFYSSLLLETGMLGGLFASTSSSSTSSGS